MTAVSRRADTVRARRAKRKVRKPLKAKGRGASRRGIPPMVARGVFVGPAAPSRTRREARRKYAIALSAPGAEVRLPALPVVRVGWRLVSGLLAAALTFALYTMWSAPQFVVSQIEVTGLERLSGAEVAMTLGLSGKSIFEVDTASIQSVLEAAFPELVDVRIHVGFPANVAIEAGERAPVLAWEQAGVLAWVDANGVAFLPRGHVEGLVHVIATEAPPVIPGEDVGSARIILPELVQAILGLRVQAPEGAPLLYDPEHGLGWADPRGWQAYFGLQPDNIQARLAVYQAIVDELTGNGVKPTLISVEYLHAPFYRTKK